MTDVENLPQARPPGRDAGAGSGNADGRELISTSWVGPLVPFRERNCPQCATSASSSKKIEHYERVAASITDQWINGSMDQFTIDRIKMLIEELRAQEASLHP
jgi:hypothetical protein